MGYGDAVLLLPVYLEHLHRDPTVEGCVDYSYGFSCTGVDSPSDTDPSLVCSDGTPDGSDTLYCCTFQ